VTRCGLGDYGHVLSAGAVPLDVITLAFPRGAVVVHEGARHDAVLHRLDHKNNLAYLDDNPKAWLDISGQPRSGISPAAGIRLVALLTQSLPMDLPVACPADGDQRGYIPVIPNPPN